MKQESTIPFYILPLIVLAQFAGTSLWFATNAILPYLTYDFPTESVSQLTLAVQLGFILGTLVLAVFSISDRFPSHRVFFISSLLGAACTLALSYNANYTIWLVLRFCTGFALAGIYPVGMKLASTYYNKGLGRALGFLVGALVLGTAFPHALVAFECSISPLEVLQLVSTFAAIGGVLILFFVPEMRTKKSTKFRFSALKKAFSSFEFKKAAFGYFGHMWELYAFWAFIPFYILVYENVNNVPVNIPLFSFIVIALGALSCVSGGYLVRFFGSEKIAFWQLTISLFCCLLSPMMLFTSFPVFVIFISIWGWFVVGDSPQFSALTAQNAPKNYIGSALTLVTSIGFAVTLFSIQLLSLLKTMGFFVWIMLPLALGPIFSVIYRMQTNEKTNHI